MLYVCTSDVDEVQRFIRDLREALKRAKQSGGGYSSFFHDENGDVKLQIEIAPKVRSKK